MITKEQLAEWESRLGYQGSFVAPSIEAIASALITEVRRLLVYANGYDVSAERIRAEERERCAKLAEESCDPLDNCPLGIANAIRALGDEP